MVYNGMKVFEHLVKLPEYFFKVEETLQHWENLPKLMEKEITSEKPLQQKDPENTFSTYEMTACDPAMEAKIRKRVELTRRFFSKV